MRYLVTGGSGYIGGRLVERLGEREDTERILIADVRPPHSFRPRTEWAELDVRDAAATRDVIARERPDVLVHLAFVLNPIKDEQRMYDIDVNGTHNVLEAASAAGVEHVLVTSSTTAYGAFPDNPIPITEDWPVRGVAAFEYARDKTESDRLCQLWALRHPERTMTIVRPCIVFGPNVDNYLVRIWTKAPFQPDFGGNLDQLIQFVHEDDLVDALVGLLEGGHGGRLQRHRRRADDDARDRRDPRHEGPQDAAEAGEGDRPRHLAPRCQRDAAGPDRVRDEPLGLLEREGEGDARLAAALHDPRDIRDHDARPRAARKRRRAERNRARSRRSGGLTYRCYASPDPGR